MSIPRTNVLGVGISALDIPLAADEVFEAADRPGFSGFVTVTGVHGVMESQQDDELRKIHNRSFLSTPDGMPMVWMSRWSGHGEVDRVYGPDLMLEVFRRSEGSGHRHYLFGGADGVVDVLTENLEQRFPKVAIVGTMTPPFRPLTGEEEDALAAELRKLKPHFFWVGLSTPKQEKFMHGFLAKYPDLVDGWGHGLVLFGVGAAFDFHAGLVKQAPRWMQRSGLEWLFRTCMEPRRLWKRYAVSNSGFIKAILPQMMDFRKHPIEK
jgi:N-acetylglucosaminyldiphosphoundecaprenol N-acetyl-beta-D-mannosaminyltransferase